MDENLKCTVVNCAYNDETLCTAKAIHVNPMGDGFANSSDGTSCKTFKPRKLNSYNSVEKDTFK